MRIGIDARFYGPAHAGLGRYTKNLVDWLAKIDHDHDYVVFMRSDNIDLFQPDNPRFQKTLADISHYSIQEQIRMPQILSRSELDLVHFPHLNVPLPYRGTFVVTIHDLIMHTFKNRAATTRVGPIYQLKHMGYRYVTRNAAQRSDHVLVPSHAVKQEIVDYYRLSPEKVSVTYEAADDVHQGAGDGLQREATSTSDASGSEVLAKYGITRPYIMYVGNVYPHKNITLLAKSLAELHKRYNLTLVLPSARSVFLERTEKMMQDHGVRQWVVLPGYVPDDDLQVLYAHGLAYVFPSLAEGFGLPPLEAMAAGLPVACSDIPVLREICADAALYFDPHDSMSLVEQVGSLAEDEQLRSAMVEKGLQRVKEFSWRTMAEQTLEVYRKCLG